MRKMYGGVNWIGKSTEEKPITGVKDGETLYLVDKGQAFVFYNGNWWPIFLEV